MFTLPKILPLPQFVCSTTTESYLLLYFFNTSPHCHYLFKPPFHHLKTPLQYPYSSHNTTSALNNPDILIGANSIETLITLSYSSLLYNESSLFASVPWQPTYFRLFAACIPALFCELFYSRMAGRVGFSGLIEGFGQKILAESYGEMYSNFRVKYR